jgi:hypothetical protein
LNSRTARTVDAQHDRANLGIAPRLRQLLAYPHQQRHPRRRRPDRERTGRRLVGQEAGDVHQEDLGVAVTLDGLFLQGADARREVERDDRAAGQHQREHERFESWHGASILRVTLRAAGAACIIGRP